MRTREYRMGSVAATLILIAASLPLGGCNCCEEPTVVDLESVNQQIVDFYNSGRFDEYFDFFHDDVVYYSPSRNLPIEGKTAVRAYYDSFLSQAKSVHWELLESKSLVKGSTGIIWGTFRHTLTGADGVASVATGRSTEIFAYSAGQWLKVYQHMSWFPVEEDTAEN